MIAIVVNNEVRQTYDNIDCYDLNINTNEIELHSETFTIPVKFNQMDTTVILKKDGVIVDWVWSEEKLKYFSTYNDRLSKISKENGFAVELNKNPFPSAFVGGDERYEK